MRLSRAEEHAELATRLCADPDWEGTLANVVEVARETLRGDHVGLLLRHHGRHLECAAVSDEVASTIIQPVLDHHEGPELSTMDEAGHILVDDTRFADRWPRWAARADRLGVRSAFSIGLQDRGRTFGSLNLYAATPAAFDDEARAHARAVATHVAIALTHAQQQRSLRQAVDARHLVGLAQGVLMERHRIDADRAFSILLRYSQDNNVKLRLVAENIVHRRADATTLPPATLALPA